MTAPDDTAALQAAIYALTSLQGRGTGGVVRLKGVNWISSPLVLTYGVTLAGEGTGGQGGGSTVIRLKAGANCDMIVPGGTYPNGSGLQDLVLDGNKAQNPSGGHGITGLDSGFLHNVRLVNHHGDGFHGVGGYLTDMDHVHVTGCDGWGMNFSGHNDSTFSKLWMSANLAGNLQVLSSAKMKFTQMQLEGGSGPVTTGPNMGIFWSSGITVTDSNLVAAVDGIRLQGGNNDIFIRGNEFSQNNGATPGTRDNINIDGSTGNDIHNVVIEGNVFNGAAVANHINLVDPGPGGHTDRIVIQGNIFQPLTGKPISLPASPVGSMSGISISGNPGYDA